MRDLDLGTLSEQFWTDGYLYFPNFFEAAYMEDLEGVIEDHFGIEPDYLHNEEFVKASHTEIVPWFPQREGETRFDDAESDEDLQKLTHAILGSDWQKQYCMVMFSKEGTSGQAWHQDCPPENKFFNLNRLVYTTNLTPEIGGEIVIMPGTHKKGVIPTGEPHEDLDNQVVILPQKGDLVLLHGHCWHRVQPIKSKYRFSINFRSVEGNAPEDITDVCVYRNMRYRFSTSELIEDRTLA